MEEIPILIEAMKRAMPINGHIDSVHAMILFTAEGPPFPSLRKLCVSRQADLSIW